MSNSRSVHVCIDHDIDILMYDLDLMAVILHIDVRTSGKGIFFFLICGRSRRQAHAVGKKYCDVFRLRKQDSLFCNSINCVFFFNKKKSQTVRITLLHEIFQIIQMHNLT